MNQDGDAMNVTYMYHFEISSIDNAHVIMEGDTFNLVSALNLL